MRRAVGANNEELSASLAELDALRSPHVIQAFRHVDRGMFVPEADRGEIYEDRPYRRAFAEGEGALHMSAPHMYASSLETLEMEPGSGHAFLNVGSGTGYFSSLAAFLVGSSGTVHSIEVFPKVVKWSKQRFAEFGAVPLIPGMPHHGVNRDVLAKDMKWVTGNALAIDVERNCKYDRIYVGAQGVEDDIRHLMRLLKPGGIMVGPFDDKLLRVRRSDDGGRYSSEQVSGVRFGPLVRPEEGDRTLVEGAEEKVQREKVEALCSACSIDASTARGLLEKVSWQVDRAAEDHLRAQAEKSAEEATPPADSPGAAAVNLPEGDPAQLSRESSQVTIEAWLQKVKLDRYSIAVKEAGYDELQFLKDALEVDIDEMLTDIEMKKPHARTFKKAWELLIAEQEEPATDREVEPEPERESDAAPPSEGHGSLQMQPAKGGGAAVRSDKTKLFGSLRFKDGRILPEARQLQTELSKVGLDLTLVDMSAGGDIDVTVFGNIERADTFIVFGTAGYGQDTGNPASTFYESKFAMNSGKRIVLIRMIPYAQRFEELQARQLFGVNKLSLEWIEGAAMPRSLVSDIVKAVGDESTAPRAH